MAEWRSFRAREQMLGLFSRDQPMGLTYPIRFADGDHFHPDVLPAQCRADFRALNYPDDVFRQSAKYIEFDDLVQRMAQELIPRFSRLPHWQDDFPVVEPDPMPPIQFSRPVL
jgi:hypothetical protein